MACHWIVVPFPRFTSNVVSRTVLSFGTLSTERMKQIRSCQQPEMTGFPFCAGRWLFYLKSSRILCRAPERIGTQLHALCRNERALQDRLQAFAAALRFDCRLFL